VHSPQGRWVLAATVLGSGMAFLDGTVVNVALPAIGEDLDASVVGLQWTVNAYLVTLSALLLLGGSLGDRLGRRRVFVAGLVVFTGASVLCGLAPGPGLLVAARAVQGVGGALLVPGSMAIIAATFHADDRGRAIGAWSGLSGVASSIGPFLGGWLIDAASWRWVFLINVPLAVVTIAIAVRHVPDTRAEHQEPLDVPGAVLVTAALAAISYGAIEQIVAIVGLGLVGLVAFVAVERASSHPMLPMHLFRSPQFSGVNLMTLGVYIGVGGTFFLVPLQLQVSLGYSALEAGAALVPFTLLLLVLSPSAGQVAQRIGARVPLTVGPLIAAVGIVILGTVDAGDSYVGLVLPGIAIFGLGMAITVAPLTAAVLGAVDDEFVGVASGVSNAVARFAGMLAVAALPAIAGISAASTLAAGLADGYQDALRIAAVTTSLGGLTAALFVGQTARVRPTANPAVQQPCCDPAVLTERRAA
jgi:EmrB/QacA subfamily drug resistance transporter